MLFRSLFRSDLVGITEVACPGGPDRHEEESSVTDLLLFPRHGSFTNAPNAGEPMHADPTRVLFLNRDEGYRVRHARPIADATTVVWVEPSALDHLLGERGLRAMGGRAFSTVAGRTSPMSDLSLRKLVRSLTQSSVGLASADGLLIEEVAVGVVADAVAPGPERPASRAGSAARRTRVRAVRRVQETIAEDLGRSNSLGSLAAITGMSPTHLSRVFHQTVGLPIHRYRRRLRLRAALDRLLEGERDLTGLALDLGFADHSHLTASMRGEYGLTPSAVRAGGAGGAGRAAGVGAGLARPDLVKRAGTS